LRILLTGRNGQVGWELERKLAPLGEVIATDRATLDLADPDQIRRVVREAEPEVIVSAAAYTAVDKAESEPEVAMRINAFAPGVLAEEAKRLGALLVHYSTDYVFDGEKATPYVEDDTPNPINVYGKTKLDGERAIQAVACSHLILRTSWVYGPRGKNFLLTILRAAREKPEVRVVDDQIGAPTSSFSVAHATVEILRATQRAGTQKGTFHVTASGRTSWFAFAVAIVTRAGILTSVIPVTSDEYSGVAKRPRNSLLDNARLATSFGFGLTHWREGLEEVWARSELTALGICPEDC
jgi:dTDP-4-dehydrorhamnose reductase